MKAREFTRRQSHSRPWTVSYSPSSMLQPLDNKTHHPAAVFLDFSYAKLGPDLHATVILSREL